MAVKKKASGERVPVKIKGLTLDEVIRFNNLISRARYILEGLKPEALHEAWELKWIQAGNIPLRKKEMLSILKKLEKVSERQVHLIDALQAQEEEEEGW